MAAGGFPSHYEKPGVGWVGEITKKKTRQQDTTRLGELTINKIVKGLAIGGESEMRRGDKPLTGAMG